MTEATRSGAALSAALGIETGPGALITGFIGGLIGGIIGFSGGQQLGDEAYDAGAQLMSGAEEEDPGGLLGSGGSGDYF